MASIKYGRYGISTVIKNLATQLINSGNSVSIGAFSFSEKAPEGVQCEDFSFFTNWMALSRKYDVVHSHTPATNFLVAFSSNRFIYEYYGSPYNFMNVNRMNLEISLGMMRVFNKKVLAISEVAADDLLRRYSGFDVGVVPLGVDTEQFTPECDGICRKGEPQLLFTGRVHPHKRIHELISAMRELVSIYPDAYLEIIGSGPELANLKCQVAKLGLSKHVGFSGWVAEDELPVHFSSCDVYVTASRWEMFGLPLLEAMACGKPVVASCIPAHRELIQKSNAGALYNLGDEKDLVNKICDIYENRECYKHHALLFAKKNNWSVVADRVMTIYLELLEENNKA